MRRLSIVVTAVIGAVLVGFATWCVLLLVEVSAVRDDVVRRVGWLMDVQQIAGDVASATEADTLHRAEQDLLALDRDLLRSRPPSDPIVRDVAVTIVELRALRGRPDDDARRKKVTASLGAATAELRAENGELSGRLASRWTALQAVALSAIAMAAGLLGVLGHAVFVLAPRLRADAARMGKLSERLEASSLAARGVGHELGGPLTSALTTLQMLRDDMRGTVENRTDHVRLLDEAIVALSRAAGTLQDLRASSDSAEEATADVHAALDEALAATRFKQGSQSRITIDAERVGLAALPQPVVRRLFTQILGRASGTKPTAGCAISVRTRQEQNLISVEFGIPGPAADADAFDGVSRALSLLGGALSVRTEAGAEIVRVELPHRAAVPGAPAAPQNLRAAAVRPVRVLLVDDDQGVLASVSRVLMRHEVTTESDPDRAIERAIAGDFDLVLCDMMMPGKTGLEVFRAVTAARPELASRFAFMSGGALDPDIADALDRAPARIDKPFGADELRRLVARFATE